MRITKTKIKEITTGLSYRGYKGGYDVYSNKGWNEDVDSLKELRTLLYEELNENPNQTIIVSTYVYDEEFGEWSISEGGITVWEEEKETVQNDTETVKVKQEILLDNGNTQIIEGTKENFINLFKNIHGNTKLKLTMYEVTEELTDNEKINIWHVDGFNNVKHKLNELSNELTAYNNPMLYKEYFKISEIKKEINNLINKNSNYFVQIVDKGFNLFIKYFVTNKIKTNDSDQLEKETETSQPTLTEYYIYSKDSQVYFEGVFSGNNLCYDQVYINTLEGIREGSEDIEVLNIHLMTPNDIMQKYGTKDTIRHTKPLDKNKSIEDIFL